MVPFQDQLVFGFKDTDLSQEQIQKAAAMAIPSLGICSQLK